MKYVIDASVALSWCFPDEKSNQADDILLNLIHYGAVVPSIWWYEIRNVFIVGERKNRIKQEETKEFLYRLSRLPIELDNSPLSDLTINLAKKHNLTIYDAAYLELAHRREFKLVTLDKALQKAARKEKVSVFY